MFYSLFIIFLIKYIQCRYFLNTPRILVNDQLFEFMLYSLLLFTCLNAFKIISKSAYFLELHLVTSSLHQIYVIIAVRFDLRA